MIKTEYFATRKDGVELERTYSDANVKIENTETGEQFDEVINPVGSGRTYKETDISIKKK